MEGQCSRNRDKRGIEIVEIEPNMCIQMQNKTIIGYTKTIARHVKLSSKILVLINCFRLYKKMCLLCELVGLKREHRNKELRNMELKSCLE